MHLLIQISFMLYVESCYVGRKYPSQKRLIQYHRVREQTGLETGTKAGHFCCSVSLITLSGQDWEIAESSGILPIKKKEFFSVCL